MADYDVFNGDADGICALLQLRQLEPRSATLITGVKRDIQLLQKIDPQAGDRVTVLDISMAKNKVALELALGRGATVFYVDHHAAGAVPASSSLISLINEAPNVSTSLLINQYLRNARVRWAAVGTFGDNLKQVGYAMLKNTGLRSGQVTKLEQLGIYMNYNGYGGDLSDLYYSPEQLYQLVLPYEDPLDFIDHGREYFAELESGYQSDLSTAEALEPLLSSETSATFMLPDEPWARRVSGVFGNSLANQYPSRAHAVITEKANRHYLVSVRAPLNNKSGAGNLCSQFPSGGGREAAAGINDLPMDQLALFLDKFKQTYAG